MSNCDPLGLVWQLYCPLVWISQESFDFFVGRVPCPASPSSSVSCINKMVLVMSAKHINNRFPCKHILSRLVHRLRGHLRVEVDGGGDAFSKPNQSKCKAHECKHQITSKFAQVFSAKGQRAIQTITTTTGTEDVLSL